jgi:hypothetical protein
VKKGKPATKRKAPVRATEERWTFKVVTNDGKHRIESSGTLFADLGESLRTLQMHIGHLARSEQDTLYVLAAHIRARLENEKKSK